MSREDAKILLLAYERFCKGGDPYEAERSEVWIEEFLSKHWEKLDCQLRQESEGDR